MEDTSFIRKGLYLQGLPFYEMDIPYIQNIRYTMTQAQASLQAFPNLDTTVPITVVDKRLMR